MKKLTILATALLICAAAFSQETPRWLRKSSISPDGKTIAFAYQGDIWTVPAAGGQAKQITTNQAHEADPIWTADGKSIVFSSYRELSKDVWIVDVNGGSPRQLTTYAGAETPLATTPDGKVLFSANIQVSAAYGDVATNPQLYSVSTEGGRVSQVLSLPVGNVSVNKDGVMLYEDIKGYEDPLRKHHVSSVTRDVWQVENGSFTKLSSYVGENRNPVFAADGKSFYYICEQSGCFNVWKSEIGTVGTGKQISSFETHPVRYISVAGDGTICCSWNGDLYTFREGETPRKVEISLTKDDTVRQKIHRSISSGITDIAASPNGKEVAVIARGDVYVTNEAAKSTRRITDTPEQERGLSFSEDGRTIYYASERDGEWAIWRSTIKDKDEKYLSFAFEREEERFTEKGQTCFQPAVSPDGKWVAFLRDRTEIVIKATKGGKEKVLLSKDVNYSYQDGDQDFAWSPDSQYLLCNYQANGGWNNEDVALIEIETGKITNLTASGYSDGGFRWTMKGKAMTWTSDKQGFRSHGSWGAERDVYVMFFDGKAFYEFCRDSSEDKIEKFLKEESKKGKKEEAKDSTKKDEKKAEKVEKLKLDLENLEDRTIRLTSLSGRLGDQILTEDGEKLYYVMRLEKGNDLCCLNIKDKSIKVVKKGFRGRFILDKEGKHVYYNSLFGVMKMNLATGSSDMVSFSSEYDYYPAAERSYIFEHCWKQVNEKFYDPQIHGIDWKGFHDNYAQFLPYIDNNYDFQELLSEMLGELNGSHTGARYRTSANLNVGHLGVLFDQEYEGKGLKIAEMLPGGVLGITDPEIKAGDLILAIDGKEIEAGTSWYDAFALKAGKAMQLTVKKGGKETKLRLIATSSDSELLYRRWVRQREEMVEKLSGGKVGYVHVKGMDSPSFREVFSKALGKYRTCDAIIIDTRHNGGGWLHDDLATLFSGKAYIEWRPRGQYIGTEPYSKWTKPSCVVTGEDNYSDASGFPYTYRALGIGKIIGAPVPGTMTAVWWETQVDNTLVFGIPQVTGWALAEDRPLENMQIEPDILVYNDPASVLRGEDKQIEAAVAEMLKEISK